MEKKTFEISNIQSNDELNSLSLALNAKEQVSHMKINKNTIVFNCIDIEALLSAIQSISKEFVVKEVIDGKLRTYDFAQRKEKEHYFMFRNILTEDDIYKLEDVLSSQYKEVHYDQANRLLTLVSDKRDVLAYVRKELYAINPSVEVFEHRKPIRSKDVFKQKYMRLYLKIAVLLVLASLAFISSKDHDQVMTTVLWGFSILILSEGILKKVLNSFKNKVFFNEDVLAFCGILLGIASQSFVETCIATILYQGTAPVLNRILQRTLTKIDETASLPEMGIRMNHGEEEEVLLSDFKVNDLMKVSPGETIHISGTIEQGTSMISTYSNNSSNEDIEVEEGHHVHSGDVNTGENVLYIRTNTLYENTNYIELMNLASQAPIYESKTEQYTKKIVKLFSPIVFVIAFVVGIVLPLIDFREYSHFIHLGAILFIIASASTNDTAASLGVLSGFAKAFKEGIIVESSLGLDSINPTQTIVYDRFDGVEVTEEELELFKKLSHMGKVLVIFNDGPVALENDQYLIYNDLTVEEKLEKMDSFVGPIVYIGDSYKDIELLQKSYVGISRGGLANMKVVESSDIVLVDADLNKVYETFVIARKMRTGAIFSNAMMVFFKTVLIIGAVSMTALPLWIVVVFELIEKALILWSSTLILE